MAQPKTVHRKWVVTWTAVAILAIAAAVWTVSAIGLWTLFRAQRLTGQDEASVRQTLGEPMLSITREDVEAGKMVFPPRGFVLREPTEVTSRVLIYPTPALGYICIFIGPDGKVVAVTRAVS